MVQSDLVLIKTTLNGHHSSQKINNIKNENEFRFLLVGINFMLRLYTFQTEDAFLKLQTEGYLVGRKELIDPYFIDGYDFMVKQMVKRIGLPPYEGQYPMWAWYQNPEVDNLEYGGHLEPGTKGVRLEIEIDPSQVVLSEFDNWHYVLNYWYLSTTNEDHDNFIREVNTCPMPEPYHSQIVKSWEKIFELNASSDEYVQATFWKLDLSQVREVNWFVAQNPLSNDDDDDDD